MNLRTTPDPKLKEAMAEIQVILKKHDIAGVIVLSSQDALEYLMEIEPSWSCARYQRTEEGVGIRINTKDLPDRATKKRMLEETIGMFMGFNDVLVNIMASLMMLAKQNDAVVALVRKQVGDIEHKSEPIE